MAKINKDKVFNFVMTKKEFEKLSEMAEKEGLSRGAFIRKKLFNLKITVK